MMCRVTRGHFGRLLVSAEGHRSAVFEPGRRTLTGARHRNGEHMCLTAATAARYLLGDLKLPEPYDSVEVDDKGIFDPLSPVDISQHARFVFNVVSVPVRVLMGACALETKKGD